MKKKYSDLQEFVKIINVQYCLKYRPQKEVKKISYIGRAKKKLFQKLDADRSTSGDHIKKKKVGC